MKRNQFALIFLTVVTMLAVWYIKSPLEASKNSNNDQPASTTRLAAILEMREALRNERATTVSALNQIIASSDASIQDKEAAQLSVKEVTALTEREVLLEVEIINLGYQDAFVHAMDDVVSVLVVKETFSAAEALEIIDMVNSRFIDGDKEVIVTHKLATELS